MSTKHGLTLESLEVLDAIDKQGSFAAAAQLLYRVPSAVTYTVKKLEEDLGVALFKREGRQSVLTPAGHVLLDQGRELLNAADRLSELVKTVDGGWEPKINIAVDSILPINWVYDVVLAFYKIKPDIEINIFEVVLGGAWEMIMDGSVDLVVGASTPELYAKNVVFRAMGEIEWVLAVSPQHPLADNSVGEAIPHERLAEHRAVVVRDSSKHSAPVSRRLFSSVPMFTVPTVEEKIKAQVKGIGVGFLPRFRIQHLLDAGDLVEVVLDDSVEKDQVYVGYKKTHEGRALQWFVEKFIGMTFKQEGASPSTCD